MKKFIFRLLFFVLIILLIITPVEIHKMGNMSLATSEIAGSEVYFAIDKSQTKRYVKKLVLGDSVGKQLYPCTIDHDSIISLACNQAITLAGQFFLLKNYIENNIDNLPDGIILLITPFSLSNDVDKYAYQYFLKPFPLQLWSVFYTEHLEQRIHTIPLYWTANLPFIQSSNYTPRWAVPSQQSTKSISTLSYEYLLKMDSITKQYGIPFRMVSTPVRDDRRNDVDSFWNNLPSDYADELESLLLPYKESVYYMPSDDYEDAVHFCAEKIPFDYLSILNDTTTQN